MQLPRLDWNATARAVINRRAAVLVVGALGVLAFELAWLLVWAPNAWLDLRVYRAGTAAWLAGQEPYAHRLTRYSLWYTYPPASLLVLGFLNILSFAWTKILWWLVNVAAIAGSLYIAARAQGVARSRRLVAGVVVGTCLAALVLEPLRTSLYAGQVEPLLMLAVLADLFVMPKRLRGVLIGLVAAVKITPLIFLPYLALRRDWGGLARAGGTFAGVTGLVWAFAPGISRAYWIHDVFVPGRIGRPDFGSNLSLYGLFSQLVTGHAVLLALWAVASALVLLCVLTIVRRSSADQPLLAVVAVAIAGLLVSPVSWSHHWVWLVLVPVLLLTGADEIPAFVRRMLWGGVLLGVASPYWWSTSGWVSGVGRAIVVVWFAALLVTWSWSLRAPRSTPRELPPGRRLLSALARLRRTPALLTSSEHGGHIGR